MKRLVASFFLVILFSSSISIAGIGQGRLRQIESTIVVVNPNALEANMTVTPIKLDGQILSPSIHSIPARGSLGLDGGALGLQPGFSGSMKLVSDKPIVGMQYSTYSDPLSPGETNRGLTANRLLPSSGLDPKVYLSLVQNSNGVKSYIAVQNAGSVNTDIVIDFYSPSITKQLSAQGLFPGGTRIFLPPTDFEGTAVVTSSEPVAVLSETINFDKGSASACEGIPDGVADPQVQKCFVWNLDDSLVTKIAMMNISESTQDGSVLFKGDSDPDWETVDCPDIGSYESVTVAPPAGATWQLGRGILTLFPKQASNAQTTNIGQSISFSTRTTDYPAFLQDTWYIPRANNKTEIHVFLDYHIPIDFKITYYVETELTGNFTLPPYVHQTIIPPLPDDTEGHAIIENISEPPDESTGLAIEVRDKQDAGDHSAYVPAYIASTVLFAPWFSYQYQILRSPVVSTILYLLLLNN